MPAELAIAAASVAAVAVGGIVVASVAAGAFHWAVDLYRGFAQILGKSGLSAMGEVERRGALADLLAVAALEER